MCDGDIDPEWIESLNSVMDDNHLLTLPNGERISFGDNVNFIFETNDLRFASPATVSRLGMIFLSEEDVDVNGDDAPLDDLSSWSLLRFSFAGGDDSDWFVMVGFFLPIFYLFECLNAALFLPRRYRRLSCTEGLSDGQTNLIKFIQSIRIKYKF